MVLEVAVSCLGHVKNKIDWLIDWPAERQPPETSDHFNQLASLDLPFSVSRCTDDRNPYAAKQSLNITCVHNDVIVA